jgi:hypothetical protein
MRRLLLPAAALSALLHCEQRFSATPPVMAPESVAPAAPSGALEALLSPPGVGAGPIEVEVSRALTITLCSASSVPCPSLDDAAMEASYRVVYGSGRAEIRSRGQAMADLYKELRDRLASGERLDAVARPPRQAGGAFSAGNGAAMKPASADSSDATSQCAFHLLDLVDGVGEVMLEVMPRFSATGCLVSLGRPTSDAGLPHCLITEPERPNRPGRKGS